MNQIFRKIHNGLIVSCQALEGEPLYTEVGGIMPLMALAAQKAGATAIRANSVRDILQIKSVVNLPLIGIIKRRYQPYEQYITVTMREIDELVDAGVDIIAFDCTNRPRCDGNTTAQYINSIKSRYPHQLIMADISNYEEGIAAQQAGADAVGTTLNSYTSYTEQDGSHGPNYGLVRRLATDCSVPVIAEGRIKYPWEARRMILVGAWSVVVGSAITRPLEITARFVHAMRNK